MKKILVAALAVICLTCLGVMAACQNENETVPNYYSVSWVAPKGISFESNVPADNEIKEGVTVTFSIVYEEDENQYDFTTDGRVPRVTLNSGDQSSVLAASENVYSFVITGNSTITVNGVFLAADYALTFGSMDTYRVSYDLTSTGLDGDVESGVSVRGGNQVDFTLNISSYYKQENYDVLANTQIITPDSNGVYSVTVTENTNITVQGLELDDNFMVREEGNGTADSPYLLKRPIDLYTMAAIINDAFYSQYYNCYYSLENDIDLDGEQLFIIGDQISGSGAFFGGDFNGNGHKISNFYIADTIYDQETYTELFIPYIGMFGYAAATQSAPASIYNLTLSDYEIVVDNASVAGSSAFIGGIVGRAAGVTMVGCKIENATYTITADDQYFAYVGGLVGAMESAYQSDSVRYLAPMVSCSAEDLSIEVIGGNVYTAGGLVGYLITSQEQTPSFVINSYSNRVNITAVNSVGTSLLNAGGIAGTLTPYGVIENCYSADGYISASSQLSATSTFHNSYAGGIVGYADTDTLVANSFTSNLELDADSVTGNAFAHTGDIAGYLLTASLPYVSSIPATVFNSVASDTITNDYIKSTLLWGEEDWVFTDTDYPTINFAETAKTFTLSLTGGEGDVFGTGNSSTLNYRLSTYHPLSYIYLSPTIGFEEYVVTNAGLRSYGYFFDEALTQRVPNSFIPIDSITLYVGFADYTDVAGTYYLDTDRYIQLDSNGIYTYYNGAQVFSTYYIYDGEEITFYSCPLFVAAEGYVSATAVLSGGILTIDDHIESTGTSALTAQVIIDNFKYGEYYAENGTTYTFYANGTGTVVTPGTSSTTTAFTFAMANGTSFTVTAGSSTVTGTINADGYVTAYGSTTVAKFDDFKGVWESKADIFDQIEFDGKGGVTLHTYSYNNNGEKVRNTDPLITTYTISEGVVSFFMDTTYSAKFDESGYLIITQSNNELTFYRENSFVGTWTFPSRSNEPVTLTLNGITANGIGTAVARYDVADADIDLTYGYTENGLVFYYFGDQFGTLKLNGKLFLEGSFYSLNNSTIESNRAFFLNDSLSGIWLGSLDNSETLTTLNFNGYGFYNQAATANYMSAISRLTINGRNIGRYTLEDGVSKGSFTYNGSYTFEYINVDEVLLLTLTSGSSPVEYTFVRPDSLYQSSLYTVETGRYTTYTFDGHGTVTATTTTLSGAAVANGTVKYSYVISTGSIALRGTNGSYGTINTATNVLTLTAGGTVQMRTTRPDSMCQTVLYNISDNARMEYTFDGYGGLTVLTIPKEGIATAQRYTYTLRATSMLLYNEGSTTSVGTITRLVLNGATIYSCTMASGATSYLTAFEPDSMFLTTLYSSTATTATTYGFGGNGKLTVTTVTTSEEGTTTSANIVYDYTVLANGDIQLKTAGTNTVVGTITVTVSEGNTTYSLTLNGGTPITLIREG